MTGMKESKRIAWWTIPILAVLAFINAGCAAVGPNYVKPDTAMPAQWPTELKGGVNKTAPDPTELARWWSILQDPLLSSLEQRAMTGNLDIQQAESRVREARARRKIAEAGFFPQADASGSYTKSHQSGDSGGGESDLYTANFDATWEIDVFGGTRRAVEAAEGDLQAAQEDLRDVLVSLAAEVGLNYLDARTYQARLAVAEKNLKAQQETYQLTQSRAQVGLATELAVQQARYNLESTRSEIPSLRTGLEGSMNRIAILLGKQPGEVQSELQKSEPIPVSPPEVAVGAPVDILRQRPDIRQAERELAAQTARVGVAVSELYPKLTLNGSIGLNAVSLSSLLLGDNRSLSFGPSLSLPIFKGGAIRGNIEVQSELQRQALVTYQTTILNALEEVENAIVAYAEEQNRHSSLEQAADAAHQAVTLAESQYNAGQTDFSNVLDAQRSLLSFQDRLAQSDGTVTSDLIRLYKALGGGWTPLSPEPIKTAKTNEDDGHENE